MKGQQPMIIKPVETQATQPESVQQPESVEDIIARRIEAERIATAQKYNIPMWMLTGFPAQSTEDDEDDDIDFE
jgi:hypothetical protein